MQPIIVASRSDTGGSSLSITTIATTSSSSYRPELEGPYEAKKEDQIKDGNAAKKSRSATRTDHPTKEDLAVKKADAGKPSVVGGPPSPTEVPGCLTNEAHTKRYIWRRFKQLIFRSMSM